MSTLPLRPALTINFLDWDIEDPDRILNRMTCVSALQPEQAAGQGNHGPFRLGTKDRSTSLVVSLNDVPLDAARDIVLKSCRGRVKIFVGIISEAGNHPLMEFCPEWQDGLDATA